MARVTPSQFRRMSNNNMPEWRQVIEKPFRFSELHIMPKTKPNSFGEGQALYLPTLLYFDARHCYERFDKAFGPGKWSLGNVKPVMSGGQLVGATGEFEARYMEDGLDVHLCACEMGAASDIEPAKGAFPDLVKRLMVPLGHRWLYEIDLGFQECVVNDKTKAFKKWTPEAMKKMEKMYTEQVTKLYKEKYPNG